MAGIPTSPGSAAISVAQGKEAGRQSGIRQTMWRWTGRGIWAVADQGLFAVTNFAVGVLLARWLSPEEYGSFTVAYAIFLFLGTIHSALLTEPMLVFGSAQYMGAFPAYLGELLRGHWWVSGIGGLLLVVTGFVFRLFGPSPIPSALIAAGVMAPFFLLSWLARRACFARLKPHWAAAGGFAYLALSLIGAKVLFELRQLTPSSMLVLLGTSSALVGFGLVRQVRRPTPQDRSEVDSGGVLAAHWNYGRWSLASSAVGWLPSNIYLVLLPTVSGLAASATLRALMNLIMPVLHGTGALATLLLPSIVRLRGTTQFRKALVAASALFTISALLYWVFVGFFAQRLLLALYGGRYVEQAHLMWILGALPVSTGLVGVLGAAVRALERPQDVFRAYVVSAVSAMTLGMWFLFRWKIEGAAAGLILGSVTTGAALLVLFLRHSSSATEDLTSGRSH